MPAALTETVIAAAGRRAAETGQRIQLADPASPGLRLRITARGQRSWSLIVRDPSGRQRRFVLGRHPALGLATARKAASALRERVRTGHDPVAEARRKRAEAQAATVTTNTLGALLDLFERQQGTSLRSWAEYRRRIESVFAAHLATPLGALTLADLQMRADGWPARQSAAAAVRYLRPILKWAAAPGRAYVARELTGITPPATVGRRQRVLAREELAALLPLFAAREDAYAAALRFMLFTLARREEVCGARWREIDLERATWTLPAERTKSDRPHVVALARQASTLLRAIRPDDAAPDALVFATATGAALGNWDRATKRIMAASGTAGWHRHDLRRTGATMLGEMGVEPHVIEAALNHAHIGGQLASIYNTARYRPAVARALQMLADALDGIARGGAEVVALTGANFG